ncbi:caspase family protein [Mucilaginibacter flavidus]|uniref:caspase family protein n=1 Tax=Mucilaginibacter flavidus TaxID=2949309 RepID=UPI002093F5B0|nr:caspase family protein [Mucilaginibacter flavidus]MCO5949233.1 caspase family protein [Mucilaginibacter flavidus]
MSVNRILAIAINDYDDLELNKIENCYSDVNKIIQVLSEKYNFDEVEFIYEKAKTSRKVLFQRLQEYFKYALESDNILVIYAGHGAYDDYLKTAYWQPSDADKTDTTSWLNVRDILALISASSANQISIVSDSCFSGALFNPPFRGGGLETLKNKKSRQALTAGGIEKVSDGLKGKTSPFAKALIEILKSNENKELPFSILAHQVILKFDKDKSQTPLFGDLQNVGHEGGTFVFQLKEANNLVIGVIDKNAYLKNKLDNLFIPIPEFIYETIDALSAKKKRKLIAVTKQDYEQAIKYRDEERFLESDIKGKLGDEINAIAESFYSEISQDKNEIKRGKALDKKINSYVQKIEADQEIIKTWESSTSPDLTNVIFSGAFNMIFNDSKDPVKRIFEDNEDKLIALYKKNVLDFYLFLLKIMGAAKHVVIKEKLDQIKAELIKIYDFEYDIVTGKIANTIMEDITRKELEVAILMWLKKEINQ